MSDSADLPLLADDLEAGLAAYMTDPDLSPPPAGRAAAIETILRDYVGHVPMCDKPTLVVTGQTVPILIVRAAFPATERATPADSPTSPMIRTARS